MQTTYVLVFHFVAYGPIISVLNVTLRLRKKSWNGSLQCNHVGMLGHFRQRAVFGNPFKRQKGKLLKMSLEFEFSRPFSTDKWHQLLKRRKDLEARFSLFKSRLKSKASINYCSHFRNVNKLLARALSSMLFSTPHCIQWDISSGAK